MTITARIGLIVAIDNKGGIGYKGDIPWRLKGDLPRFKALTLNNVVIMGRKTWESLPGPLAGRWCIVISSKPISYTGDVSVTVVSSIEAAIEAARKIPTDMIYFIGGAKIYEAALPFIDIAQVTQVHLDSPTDTTVEGLIFPIDQWERVNVESTATTDPDTGFLTYTHSFLTFIRKPKQN